MGIKIGINGFGRIGRVVLRILADDPERFEVCGINLRKADVDYMVYLLKYDSVFRNFPGIVEHAGGDLIVNGRKIKVYSESDAAMINWADCGAEYIIESTGANNTTDKASRHFKGGAKKVILTAPAKDDATPTFVFGVNSDEYRSDMRVISNARYHQLPCAAGLCHPQGVRYRAVPDVHHPRLHRQAEGRGLSRRQ